MKRTLALLVGAVAGVLVLAGLVHAVLIAAGVSAPAANTVYGLTSRRLWATAVAALALVGALTGGFALDRAVRRGGNHGRHGAIVALVAGSIAAVNGGLVLAFADGGPGSGNGVVGGAGALVLGLIALVVGGLALRRSKRLTRSTS